MNGRGLRAFATLALSLVAFAVSAGAAAVGAQEHSLFIEPGRVGVTSPPEAASGR